MGICSTVAVIAIYVSKAVAAAPTDADDLLLASGESYFPSRTFSRSGLRKIRSGQRNRLESSSFHVSLAPLWKAQLICGKRVSIAKLDSPLQARVLTRFILRACAFRLGRSSDRDSPSFKRLLKRSGHWLQCPCIHTLYDSYLRGAMRYGQRLGRFSDFQTPHGRLATPELPCCI